MLSTKYVYKSYLIDMYKQDLTLNNLKWLTCHKTKPNQTINQLITQIYLYLSLIGIILRWGFLIWELINSCSFFVCCFFFHYVSAKFHLWPSSGDLPRPRIGMLSLVTVSPVTAAFRSCCLSHHVFSKSR